MRHFLEIRETQLAPYATRASQTRGRHHPEDEDHTRTPFQRDRDRIIHASAFRRLKHKTQVFVEREGDYYRTRLTHSLEVAQITRSLCRLLGLDEDLGEALALAHDLGHPPFGHGGEHALNTCMKNHGGFDHNAHALRIVTLLEERYPTFNGLNLTWETLEGLVKHNGPLKPPLHEEVHEYAQHHDLELHTHAGPEAQVAALSDDIAYNSHDIDDGLRAKLFSLDQLRHDVPLLNTLSTQILQAHPHISSLRLIYSLVRRLIGTMIRDVAKQTLSQLQKQKPQTAADIRLLPTTLVTFSQEMEKQNNELRTFLHKHMYRHPKVIQVRRKMRKVVEDLFETYCHEPELLPQEWQENCQDPRSPRHVCDFLAGMTDRYALRTHKHLFDPHAD